MEIQRQALLVLIHLQRLPRHCEIFVADSGKSAEIKDRILDVTVLGIDDQIFDAR